MIKMACGVLNRKTILHNHAMQIKIPKGTIVDMATIDNTPTIFFRDMQTKCYKVNGKWYADFFSSLMLIQFPKGKQNPYPFSYFGKEVA